MTSAEAGPARPLLAAAALVAAGILGLTAAGCREALDANASRTYEFRGPTMGTAYVVQVVTGPEGLADDLHRRAGEAIREELDLIDERLSTWRRDSELSRWNAAGTTADRPLSAETWEVLLEAFELSAKTGGALDVTVAPLVDAWGFGPAGPVEGEPTEARIAELLAATGMDLLGRNDATRTVAKKLPAVRCDLSALAAGYAADRVAARLAALGLGDVLVDMGGELLARGRNAAGRPWNVAVERPRDSGARVAHLTVGLSDAAIATSGDYRKYREQDGRRLSHVIDPRTGRPVSHRLASVTVLDPSAMRADALSTALMVLGPDEGLALAERMELAAFFLVRDPEGDGFVEHSTAAFRELAGRDATAPGPHETEQAGR